MAETQAGLGTQTDSGGKYVGEHKNGKRDGYVAYTLATSGDTYVFIENYDNIRN